MSLEIRCSFNRTINLLLKTGKLIVTDKAGRKWYFWIVGVSVLIYHVNVVLISASIIVLV